MSGIRSNDGQNRFECYADRTWLVKKRETTRLKLCPDAAQQHLYQFWTSVKRILSIIWNRIRTLCYKKLFKCWATPEEINRVVPTGFIRVDRIIRIKLITQHQLLTSGSFLWDAAKIGRNPSSFGLMRSNCRWHDDLMDYRLQLHRFLSTQWEYSMTRLYHCIRMDSIFLDLFPFFVA